MIDQVKIGGFLKDLRKEKGLTQEQLAEKFGVSSRSVSRWENGNTMPELGILVELAEYYEVDIKEIIDGERKSELKLNAKLTSGLNSAILFCQTNFWFGYFSAFFQLFFHVFGDIIKKNAWIFGYTKSAPRTHRCKSNFWMPLCMVIHFVSSCLFCFTSIT